MWILQVAGPRVDVRHVQAADWPVVGPLVGRGGRSAGPRRRGRPHHSEPRQLLLQRIRYRGLSTYATGAQTAWLPVSDLWLVLINYFFAKSLRLLLSFYTSYISTTLHFIPLFSTYLLIPFTHLRVRSSFSYFPIIATSPIFLGNLISGKLSRNRSCIAWVVG